jgi:hypothetical protein
LDIWSLVLFKTHRINSLKIRLRIWVRRLWLSRLLSIENTKFSEYIRHQILSHLFYLRLGVIAFQS